MEQEQSEKQTGKSKKKHNKKQPQKDKKPASGEAEKPVKPGKNKVIVM